MAVKICSKHGEEYIKRCKSCAAEAVIKRRNKIKRLAVEYKGGCCSFCGYNKSLAALDFHHIDPSKKEFRIASYSKSWERIKDELDKCILLCSNCHRELHESLNGE